MIDKNKKSGPLYLRWYKLKTANRLCEWWADYEKFVYWYELWIKELGTSDIVFIQPKDGVLNPQTLRIRRREDVEKEKRFYDEVKPKWRALLNAEEVCDAWKSFYNFLEWYVLEQEGGGTRLMRKAKGLAGPETMILGSNPTRAMVDTYNKVARKKKMCPEWSGKDGRQVFYYWMQQDYVNMDTEPLFCSDTASEFTYFNEKNIRYEDRPAWINDEYLQEAIDEFKAMAYGADKLNIKIYDTDCSFWEWLDTRRERFSVYSIIDQSKL